MHSFRDKLLYLTTEIKHFLTNKRFILHFLGIILFIFFLLFGVMQWLNFYTNHGQKLEIPDYIDQHLTDAAIDARKKTFKIIVNDSLHIVGKPGGLIVNQNPGGGSLVKEGRKIYVTTTKYGADIVDISSIRLFGADYALIKQELNRKGIGTRVIGTKYDPVAEEGSIYEVWLEGQIIKSARHNPDEVKVEKGKTLDFILSTSSGGSVIVPNIVGKSVSDASFELASLRLIIGDITFESGDGDSDRESAIIVSQYPVADSSTLPIGTAIDVLVRGPNDN